MNNSVPDIPLCIREKNAIVRSEESLLFNRVLIIVYDAAVVSVYKSHIFVLFCKVLIANEDRMRWGRKDG